MTRRLRSCAASAALAGALAGCGASSPEAAGTSGPTPAPPGAPYATLEAWHLFTDARAGTPAPGVVPYEVVAPLFTDYTLKARYLWVPPGTRIGWEDEARWRFPVGSIVIKTFALPVDARDPGKGRRVLETRLLVHEDEATWVPHTYVWDEAQTTAKRVIVGATIDVSWIDEAGATRTNAYGVPNTNECLECHGKVGKTSPLGPRTRQLARDHDFGSGPEDQIDHLASLGLLDGTPPPKEKRQRLVDPFGTAPIADRGRAYLDANCAHCHGIVGLAKGTAFWLDYDHTDPVHGNPTDWGVCKVPASAGGGGTCGLGFDVVPGHAAESIVPCRMKSTEPKIAMPPLGHALTHAEGIALVEQWIDAMPPQKCE